MKLYILPAKIQLKIKSSPPPLPYYHILISLSPLYLPYFPSHFFFTSSHFFSLLITYTFPCLLFSLLISSSFSMLKKFKAFYILYLSKYLFFSSYVMIKKLNFKRKSSPFSGKLLGLQTNKLLFL